LLVSTIRVAIPLSVAVAAVVVPVYLVALQLGFDLDTSRTVLTSMAVICGLGLLPIIQPRRGEGGRWTRWWPWAVAVVMLVVYLGLLAAPLARDFYELAPLRPDILAVILVVGGGWTIALHAVDRLVRGRWP
jgi:hypothetical protein